MARKLPIVIVDPHGGLDIPPELKDRIALTENQIFNEADAYTNMLYDFHGSVLDIVRFPYARAIIDVNRPYKGDDMQPSGDGIIKRQTSYGAPVYFPGAEPDRDFEENLIRQYWQTWHDQLARMAVNPEVKLVIDAHTMAAYGPTYYGDPGAARPRVMVGNRGGADGRIRPDRGFITASATMARDLTAYLGDLLGDIPGLTSVGLDAKTNSPYSGGWDLQAHGGKYQPWIMIEVNRGLYVGAQDGDSPVIAPDCGAIGAVRDALWGAIEAITRKLLDGAYA